MAVQYIDLRNQGGTIINKATGQSYKDPTQLAVDLGIRADNIEWGRIAEEAVGTPTATGTVVPRNMDEPITPADLQSEEPIKNVDKPIDETDYGSITAGALPPPPTDLDIEQKKAETEASTLSTSITDLLEESQTEGDYKQQQLEQAGAPQYEKDVQDLTNQLRSLQMESQANRIRIENQTKTTGHISGELQRNERDTAIRTLTTSAQLQAVQGNLSLALNQAQRAVDLKYKPIADKLAVMREQYEMNKDALERIDKKQANALAERIRKDEADLAIKKQRDSDLNSIALKAAEGGAPSSVVNAIKNSRSTIDAIGLATGFLDTDLQLALQKQTANQADIDRKFEEDKRQFDINTAIKNRDLNISAMNAQTSRINATKKDTTPAGIEVSQMSPEAQAVLNGTLRLEDLTPTTKGKIAGELNMAGYKSTPKLSSTQQDEIATMETVKSIMNKIEAYNADGQLEGIGGFWQGSMGGLMTQYFGQGSEEAKNVRALIGNVKGTIAKLRGGTSFTPNEQKMLEGYTPTIDESAASVLSKIEMLRFAIDKKKSELLSVAQDRKLPGVNAEELRTKYNY